MHESNPLPLAPPLHGTPATHQTSPSVLEEIAEIRGLQVPELVNRYETAFGKPPRSKHREWLWRQVAWKIQERRFGGLSVVAKKRLDELIAELDLPLSPEREVRGRITSSGRSIEPVRGTTLTRIWKGREIQVTAVEGGWDLNGVVHRSLSAAAKALTGSHWNGRLFFGLTKRRAN